MWPLNDSEGARELAVAVLLISGLVALVIYTMAWIQGRTRYNLYYALSREDRQALRKRIQRKARMMAPVFKFASRLGLTLPPTSFKGTKVVGICTLESMKLADEFTPTSDDIFVVTQMKCGTTWMQQIVFEILGRGQGDLTESGYGHLYNVSPWIESEASVKLEEAPFVGREKRRIIKTHLATNLCPYSAEAK